MLFHRRGFCGLARLYITILLHFDIFWNAKGDNMIHAQTSGIKQKIPVGGKACSSTKGGLLRYIPNTYSNHKVSSF